MEFKNKLIFKRTSQCSENKVSFKIGNKYTRKSSLNTPERTSNEAAAHFPKKIKIKKLTPPP